MVEYFLNVIKKQSWDPICEFLPFFALDIIVTMRETTFSAVSRRSLFHFSEWEEFPLYISRAKAFSISSLQSLLKDIFNLFYLVYASDVSNANSTI